MIGAINGGSYLRVQSTLYKPMSIPGSCRRGVCSIEQVFIFDHDDPTVQFKPFLSSTHSQSILNKILKLHDTKRHFSRLIEYFYLKLLYGRELLFSAKKEIV